MTRVVVESLDRIASPHARDSVLFMALADAKIEAVPEDPALLRRFVLGPLKRAIDAAIGREAAEAVLSDLGPIIERAQTTLTSGVRPKATQAGDKALLIATPSRDRADVLQALAPEGAIIRIATDVFTVVSGLEQLRNCQLALVIDCQMPSLRPAGLATLARILPPTARVVLWGSSEAFEAEAIEVGLPESWIRLDASTTPSNVSLHAFPDEAGKRDTVRPPAVVHERPTVVLVVDANATSRGATVGCLSRGGCTVVTAPDAYMALDLAADRHPDVVVVDETLPGVSGANLLRLMRRVLGLRAPATILFASAGNLREVDGADVVLEREGASSNQALLAAVDALRRKRDGS